MVSVFLKKKFYSEPLGTLPNWIPASSTDADPPLRWIQTQRLAWRSRGGEMTKTWRLTDQERSAVEKSTRSRSIRDRTDVEGWSHGMKSRIMKGKAPQTYTVGFPEDALTVSFFSFLKELLVFVEKNIFPFDACTSRVLLPLLITRPFVFSLIRKMTVHIWPHLESQTQRKRDTHIYTVYYIYSSLCSKRFVCDGNTVLITAQYIITEVRLQ